MRAEIVMFHHTGFVWFHTGYWTMHCDPLHRDGEETVATVGQDSLDRLIEAMGHDHGSLINQPPTNYPYRCEPFTNHMFF